ncbi:hypothetical protein [Priestia aryabhattai]|uniref:hypothetical protein n=1 Tax=Priestia aryabhattai TaxID=412384 RepID=UPI002E1A3B5F|nr:hypothetical protein [Priestia aryabhattai]
MTNFIFCVVIYHSGCSNSEDVKLSKAEVMLVNNNDLVGESTKTIREGKNETSVPTALN